MWKELGHIPAEEIDKITHLNAMRVFHFDPFPHRPREKCTVGALRAEAADVYTGYHHAPKRGNKPARAAALRANIAAAEGRPT